MLVTAVILNYNSSEDCRRCIDDLRRQQGVDMEIVVVDNCSPQTDREAVAEICAERGVTLVDSPSNGGYNAGNNVGLRYAAEHGSEFALIANPDMQFPQTDYVARLVKAMVQDPDIVVCASDIVGLDGRHQNPMAVDGDWKSSFGWLTGLFRTKKADTYSFIDDYAHSHVCGKVSGCCLLVRMSFMQEVGYFDEGVFLYCEEAILSRQVAQAGKKMMYQADCQAVHAHRNKPGGDKVRGFRHWQKSRLYFIDKYSGDPWYGKLIAKLSLRLNVFTTQMALRVKKFFI